RVLGPCWVFLDNPREQEPQIAVQARNGQIWREGDLPFDAIKVLVTPSDDEEPLDPNEPEPGVCP
ncbi:MAG: hypothetical protein FJZ00_06545, partial [Candidatus Sericytochromatia bacterium]|nr:hypothetical protein [Candidatus Tanganyikabacteria bacterium]